MAEQDTPIAWLALREGTSIYTRDGDEIGKVGDVVADRQKDIFSGITFKRGLLEGAVFVPADNIEEITTDGVKLNISSDEAANLERYES